MSVVSDVYVLNYYIWPFEADDTVYIIFFFFSFFYLKLLWNISNVIT